MVGIGEQGEILVADWLVTKKAIVLKHRWHQRRAEIDLIAQKEDGTLLFIEVKTRSHKNWDLNGLLAIDQRKQQKIILGASLFLGCYPELSTAVCRFDVALVQHSEWPWSRSIYSRHLENGQYLHLAKYFVAAFDSH